MRVVLRRTVQLTAVAVLATVTAALPASPGAGGEKQRTVTKDYVTAPGVAADCSAGEGAACFELAGDEFSVGLTIEDDEGWRDIPLHFRFDDAEGHELSSGDHCGSGMAMIPPDAAVLSVSAALVTVGRCSHPTVSRSGSVTGVFELKRNAKDLPADEERRCTGGLGEPASYALSPDDARRVQVDALILLDGIDEPTGSDVMSKVVRGFADDGIDLVPTLRAVSLTPTSLKVNDLFRAIKDSVGGEVPEGFDLVHVLTDKDIESWAGYAFCVGGIQSRDHAFSMSEVRGQKINIIGGVPVPVWYWGDDYMAGHEIGHLFGGGHDLANCVEGVAVVEGETPAPCTLMHPNLNVSYVFSTVNRAIVRGHAIDFVAD